MAIVKNIQDYYEQMYEKYPTVSKSDIKRILQYGWKSFYRYNNYGADTLIQRKGFWFYCGKLMTDSFKYFDYYATKLSIKLRINYLRKRIPWNGCYYFALTKDQYENYLKQINKRGRPKKRFKFKKIIAYKIFDECNIRQHGNIAIFKLETILEKGFTIYYEELITDKAELVLLRDPLKFKDILLTNYNYQVL